MTNEEKTKEMKVNDICCVKQHSIVYVVTRCEEHDDYVEEVFFDIEKAKQCCAKYNSNEDNYRRHITKVNVTL